MTSVIQHTYDSNSSLSAMLSKEEMYSRHAATYCYVQLLLLFSDQPM